MKNLKVKASLLALVVLYACWKGLGFVLVPLIGDLGEGLAVVIGVVLATILFKKYDNTETPARTETKTRKTGRMVGIILLLAFLGVVTLWGLMAFDDAPVEEAASQENAGASSGITTPNPADDVQYADI